MFSTQVKNLRLNVRKVRKKEGAYLYGIELRLEVISRNSRYGGPLKTRKEKFVN